MQEFYDINVFEGLISKYFRMSRCKGTCFIKLKFYGNCFCVPCGHHHCRIGQLCTHADHCLVAMLHSKCILCSSVPSPSFLTQREEWGRVLGQSQSGFWSRIIAFWIILSEGYKLQTPKNIMAQVESGAKMNYHEISFSLLKYHESNLIL